MRLVRAGLVAGIVLGLLAAGQAHASSALTPSADFTAGSACAPNGAISGNGNSFLTCTGGVWVVNPVTTTNLYASGNVGIGTANSGSNALQVNGTVTAAAFSGMAASCQTVTASGSGSTAATATATCPGNLKVISGGFGCSGGYGLYNQPESSTSWMATCYQYGGSINVTAYAICCP